MKKKIKEKSYNLILEKFLQEQVKKGVSDKELHVNFKRFSSKLNENTILEYDNILLQEKWINFKDTAKAIYNKIKNNIGGIGLATLMLFAVQNNLSAKDINNISPSELQKQVKEFTIQKTNDISNVKGRTGVFAVSPIKKTDTTFLSQIRKGYTADINKIGNQIVGIDNNNYPIYKKGSMMGKRLNAVINKARKTLLNSDTLNAQGNIKYGDETFTYKIENGLGKVIVDGLEYLVTQDMDLSDNQTSDNIDNSYQNKNTNDSTTYNQNTYNQNTNDSTTYNQNDTSSLKQQDTKLNTKQDINKKKNNTNIDGDDDDTNDTISRYVPVPLSKLDTMNSVKGKPICVTDSINKIIYFIPENIPSVNNSVDTSVKNENEEIFFHHYPNNITDKISKMGKYFNISKDKIKEIEKHADKEIKIFTRKTNVLLKRAFPIIVDRAKKYNLTGGGDDDDTSNILLNSNNQAIGVIDSTNGILYTQISIDSNLKKSKKEAIKKNIDKLNKLVNNTVIKLDSLVDGAIVSINKASKNLKIFKKNDLKDKIEIIQDLNKHDVKFNPSSNIDIDSLSQFLNNNNNSNNKINTLNPEIINYLGYDTKYQRKGVSNIVPVTNAKIYDTDKSQDKNPVLNLVDKKQFSKYQGKFLSNAELSKLSKDEQASYLAARVNNEQIKYFLYIDTNSGIGYNNQSASDTMKAYDNNSGKEISLSDAAKKTSPETFYKISNNMVRRHLFNAKYGTNYVDISEFISPINLKPYKNGYAVATNNDMSVTLVKANGKDATQEFINLNLSIDEINKLPSEYKAAIFSAKANKKGDERYKLVSRFHFFNKRIERQMTGKRGEIKAKRFAFATKLNNENTIINENGEEAVLELDSLLKKQNNKGISESDLVKLDAKVITQIINNRAKKDLVKVVELPLRKTEDGRLFVLAQLNNVDGKTIGYIDLDGKDITSEVIQKQMVLLKDYDIVSAKTGANFLNKISGKNQFKSVIDIGLYNKYPFIVVVDTNENIKVTNEVGSEVRDFLDFVNKLNDSDDIKKNIITILYNNLLLSEELNKNEIGLSKESMIEHIMKINDSMQNKALGLTDIQKQNIVKISKSEKIDFHKLYERWEKIAFHRMI